MIVKLLEKTEYLLKSYDIIVDALMTVQGDTLLFFDVEGGIS